MNEMFVEKSPNVISTKIIERLIVLAEQDKVEAIAKLNEHPKVTTPEHAQARDWFIDVAQALHDLRHYRRYLLAMENQNAAAR